MIAHTQLTILFSVNSHLDTLPSKLDSSLFWKWTK